MTKSEIQAIISRGLLVLLELGIAAALGGCGGANMQQPPGNTNVVVLMTSTANDRLANFDAQITKVSLSDKSGNVVTLFSSSPPSNSISGLTEFTHLNGNSEPLVTVSVPQGTYTSATIELGSCQFTTVSIDSSTGGLLTATDAEGLCGDGTGKATVNLSSPIMISGSVMALSFNLQVSQSFTVSPPNFSITPVFALAPTSTSSQPTNDQNGKLTGINARITSMNASGSSFIAQSADGISTSISTDASTQFQGVSGFPSLSTGMLVNIDLAIQPSGSLLATRVEADNPSAVALDVGLPISPTAGITFIAQDLECFPGPNSIAPCECCFQFSGSTAFHVSGQVDNLQNLPFVPNFGSLSFLLGQSVSFASTNPQAAPKFVTDVTLEPQTINGTVTAVSNAGNFSVYTVEVASYDIIPVTQSLFLGGFPAITSPTSVVVYADSNTQLVQSGSIIPGSVFRFRGLIFDDGGTLRMDCVKILDGVPE